MSMSKFSKSLGEITNINIEGPLAASSPNATKVPLLEASNNLSIRDQEKLIQAEKKRIIEQLEITLKEKVNTFNEVINGIYLSSSEFSKPPTLEDIKAIRKLLQKKCKAAKGKSNLKNKEIIEKDATEMQEEEDSITLGQIVESGCSSANPISSSSSSQENNRAKKKIKFMTDKGSDEDDDETVFKKPKDRSAPLNRNQSQFRTPRNRNTRGYNVAVVTPGPNSQKPVNILRRPDPGEMAISMAGSPLLVAHTNVPVNVPQISIPLSDGRVMTVIADEGLDPDMSLCSDIDPETKERLLILQQLLKKKIK